MPISAQEAGMSDSENAVRFVCPNCGGDQFRTNAEPKTLDDMLGAPCAKCGTPLTEDDIKAQGMKNRGRTGA